MKGYTQNVARTGMAAALAVVILYISALLPSGQLAGVCVASVCVAFAGMRCGWLWGGGCFAASAVLALLLVPQKGMAILYAVFLGFYPLIKLATERLPAAAIRWAVRLVIFNLMLFLVCVTPLWKLVPVVSVFPYDRLLLFAVANIGFVIYDYALTQVILLYLRKIDGRM